MKNIHVLPTDKETRLFIADGKLFNYHKHQQGDGVKVINQNIYITSDEEIKKGDWYLDFFNSQRIKANVCSDHKHYKNDCKKIILTTDQDLIKDGVQAIDDEFLEWFVKNPSCEEVETIIDWYFNDIWHNRYRIIIPKEEAKQETLEEVALEFAKDHHEMYETSNLGSMHFGFCWGAKWQAERMYSEEEVKHLMTLAFEQGFKKADIVEAGLEAKETDTEVNWIFLKHKKMIGGAQPKILLTQNEEGNLELNKTFENIFGKELEPKYKLIRGRDQLTKTSVGVKWLEFDEDGRYKADFEDIAVGRSLLMSPFGPSFTWQCTEVTEILEQREDYIKFKTLNSTYELFKLS